MKVLVNGLFAKSDGIIRYAVQLMVHLKKRHPEVDFTLLVSPDNQEKFSGAAGSVFMKIAGVRSLPARLFFYQLLQPFRMGGYDLLHSVSNMGMAFCPIPQVLSVMDTYESVSPERFSPLKRMLMKMLISLSGKNAKRIITISENTARDVVRFYPHTKGKVGNIYLGRSFSVRTEAPAAGNDFLFVGTMEPGKNLQTVLRAFRLFKDSHPHRRLRIIGAEGWGKTGVKELIDELNLGSDVYFSGFVTDEELEKAYTTAHALVLASTYEGFGLPVIEAMACGCPVIAAKNSSLPEAGGEAALYFETLLPEDLSEKMEMLESQPGLRAFMIEKGFRHAAGFRWEDTADRTFDVYKSVLPPPGNVGRG